MSGEDIRRLFELRLDAREPNPSSKPPSAVPDVLAPGLRVAFCGINPGRWSAAAGAHSAHPRNDFWRLLHDAGFPPRVLAPEEQHELPSFGYGLTNAASCRPRPRRTPRCRTPNG